MEAMKIEHEEIEPTFVVDKQRLETIMRQRNYTIPMLAEEVGVHQNTIASLKRIGTTRMDTLTKICQVLNCHPFDLLVADGFPEPFSASPASH